MATINAIYNTNVDKVLLQYWNRSVPTLFLIPCSQLSVALAFFCGFQGHCFWLAMEQRSSFRWPRHFGERRSSCVLEKSALDAGFWAHSIVSLLVMPKTSFTAPIPAIARGYGFWRKHSHKALIISSQDNAIPGTVALNYKR